MRNISYQEYYRYREVRIPVESITLRLPNNMTKELRTFLHTERVKENNLTSYVEDNYECFMFLDEACEVVYVMFADNITYFGNAIAKNK